MEEETGTATVEEVQLLKTLRWWDGFIIALCNPGFLLGSLGYTLGIFGVVGSMYSDWMDPVLNDDLNSGNIIDMMKNIPAAPIEVPPEVTTPTATASRCPASSSASPAARAARRT